LRPTRRTATVARILLTAASDCFLVALGATDYAAAPPGQKPA